MVCMKLARDCKVEIKALSTDEWLTRCVSTENERDQKYFFSWAGVPGRELISWFLFARAGTGGGPAGAVEFSLEVDGCTVGLQLKAWSASSQCWDRGKPGA